MKSRDSLSVTFGELGTGTPFAAALEQHGYMLAKGDRRDFVVVDHHGEVYSLAKCIEGARMKDVRARMTDPGQVPTVAQARALQQARQLARAERAPEIPVRGSLRSLSERGAGSPEARAANRAGDRIGGGIEGAAGKVLDGLAGMFESLFAAPREPPTPEELRHEARRGDEAARLAGFRQYVAEQSRLFETNEQIRDQQQQRERDEQDLAARRARDAPARDGPER